MANSDILKGIIGEDVCQEACDFADLYDTPQEAWDAATRGDWLLLWLGSLVEDEAYGESRRVVIPLVCRVARMGIHLSAQAQAATEAIDFAEAWGFGDPNYTEDDIRAYMETVETNEPGEDIEGVFITPLYVITSLTASEVGQSMQSMAQVQSTLVDGSGLDLDRLAEIAVVVKQHFIEAPLSQDDLPFPK